MGLFDIISKKKLLVIFLILLLPTIIWLLVQRTFITVKIDGVQGDDVTVLYTVNGGVKQIRPGLNYVKPGEAIINVVSDENQSLAFKKVSILRNTTVSLKLENQKATTKVVGGAKKQVGCVVGNLSENTTSVLSCQNDQLYRQTVDNGIKHENVYPNQKIIGSTVPYKNGILAIVGDTSGGPAKYKLVYTTQSGQKLINEGEEVEVGDAGNPRIFTSNDGDKIAVLNPQTQNITIYESSGKVSAKSGLDGAFSDIRFEQLTAEFNDSSMKIAYPLTDPNNTDDVFGGSNAKVKLFRYTISNNKLTKESDETLETGKIGGDITLKNGRLIILGQDSFLHVFDTSTEKPKLLVSIPRVDNIAVTTKNIFYSSSKGVYELFPEERQSRLRSNLSAINESHLLVYNDRPALVGNTNNNVSTFGVYVVKETDDTEDLDLFKLLPYDTDVLPLINSDYIGNQVFLSVSLKSLVLDRVTGSVSYNQAEFEQKKVIITEKLKSDGLDIKKYKLNFKPGP